MIDRDPISPSTPLTTLLSRGPTSPELAALLLRVSLGAVFISHAGLKLLVFGLDGTAAFFAAHGFPGWTAHMVFTAELLGGIALVLGTWTRLVALALVPVMFGALTVHWPNGFWFDAPNGGWEYVAFLVVALVTQALLGDGACALGRHSARDGSGGGASGEADRAVA